MSTPVSGYRLRVFGAAGLYAPDGTLVDLSERALAYVVYLRLAVIEKPTATAIAQFLWSKKNEDSLRDSLHQLRQEIRERAPGLQRGYDRKQRFAAPLECDADRVQQGEDAPLAERLEVLEMLAGGFMAGFAVPNGAEKFEEWMLGQRKSYDETLSARLAAEAAPADDEDPSVLARLGEIGLRRDPHDFAAARMRVRGLALMGERGEAGRALRDFVNGSPASAPDLAAVFKEAHRAWRARTPATTPAPPRGEPAASPAGLPDASHPAGLPEPAAKTPDSAPEPDPAPAEATNATEPGATNGPRAEVANGPAGVRANAGATLVAGEGADSRRSLVLRMPAGRGGLLLAAVMLAAAALVVLAGVSALLAMRPRECGGDDLSAQAIDQDRQPGTAVEPDEPFTKSWRLVNTGRCTWPASSYLRFETTRRDGLATPQHLSTSQGDMRLGAPVPPGGERPMVMGMKAPETPGSYEEFWSLRGPGGHAVQVEGSAGVTVSVVVLPRRIPLCGPGAAAQTLVATRAPAAARAAPGEAFELDVTFRNTGACIWRPGVALDLNLPAQAVVLDSAPPRTLEEVRPHRAYTFAMRVRLPPGRGAYPFSAALRDGEGETLASPDGSGRGLTLPVGEPPRRVPRTCRTGELGARFVSETVVDNTLLAPDTPFVKEWTITNASPRLCTWAPGVVLHRLSSDSLSQVDEVRIPRAVLPGDLVVLRVRMRAPGSPGVHREDWELRDWRGNALKVSQAETVWALVIVAGGRPPDGAAAAR